MLLELKEIKHIKLLVCLEHSKHSISIVSLFKDTTPSYLSILWVKHKARYLR